MKIGLLGLLSILFLGLSQSAGAGEVFRDCDLCPEMVTADGGSAIAMGRYEVTRAQYAAFVKATDYPVGAGCMYFNGDGDWGPGPEKSWRDPGFKQADDHPAACINWDDASAYTEWLSSLTAKPYRLPSSAEWEAAARSGATTARPWGEEPAGACAYGNTFDESARNALKIKGAVHLCEDSAVFTSAIGSYAANDQGLFDMIGNVFEWTSDCEECAAQEIRGGCWYSGPSMSTVAYRFAFKRDFRGSGIGFRVVREN